MTPRRRFHVLLGSVFVPVVSLPIVWGVALASRRRAADPETRRWARRMLGLAAVDTVVAAAFVALTAGGIGAEMRTVGGPVAEDRAVIGVMPDASFRGQGVRIAEVVPGSPAEAAGVRPGDVVVEFAGEGISSPASLRSAVEGKEPGLAVPLGVVRGESRLSLTVTPRGASELPRPAPRPLARADRLEACAPHLTATGVLPTAALVAAVAILGALVRRRARVAGAARAVWWTGGALVAATVAGLAFGTGACLALGGPTAAAVVPALWGSTLALGGTALAGLRLVGGEDAPAERTWRSAVALGAWYLATGLPRLAVLLGGAMQVAASWPGDSAPVESLVAGFAADHEYVPVLLLGLNVVLLGPVAEEVAFRGLLQPALGKWLGPAGSVAVTSVLFASAHWYYGLRVPIIAFVAAVLGWARVASGGLRAPIALHVLVNAVNLAALLL